MKTSRPQGLIHIDVAQSRKKSLIQQEGFQLPAPGEQVPPEPALRKILSERFRSQAPQHLFRVTDQDPTPEFPRIHELKPTAVVQSQGEACRPMFSARRFEIYPSAHPQMCKQVITAVQGEYQILGPAPYGQNPASEHTPDEAPATGQSHNPGPAKDHLAYPVPGNPPPAEITGNGFNFREFRHGNLPPNSAVAAPFRAVPARRPEGAAASHRRDLRGILPGDRETHSVVPAASSAPDTRG